MLRLRPTGLHPEFMCASDGARTRGPYIKSVVLYQLSYERILEKSFPDLTQLIYYVPTYIWFL